MKQVTHTPPTRQCTACKGLGEKPLPRATQEVWHVMTGTDVARFTIPSICLKLGRPSATIRQAMGDLVTLGHVHQLKGERGHNDALLYTLTDKARKAIATIKIIRQHGLLKHGRLVDVADGWYWVDANDAQRAPCGPFDSEEDARDHARDHAQKAIAT